MLMEECDEQVAIKTCDQCANCSVYSRRESGFQGRLHADDRGDAGVVGHACSPKKLDDQADGDGKAGLDDPHTGRVADEERSKSLPDSVFLHIINLCLCGVSMILDKQKMGKKGDRRTKKDYSWAINKQDCSTDTRTEGSFD